jgi:hypothetical protein
MRATARASWGFETPGGAVAAGGAILDERAVCLRQKNSWDVLLTGEKDLKHAKALTISRI